MLRQVGPGGRGAVDVARHVSPDRRDRRRRVARRARAGDLRARSSTRASRATARRGGCSSTRTSSSRSCTASARRARRDRAQSHRSGRARAGRGRRDGHVARPGQGGERQRARALCGRRRRQPQPDARSGSVSPWRATASSRAASRSTSAPTARRCCEDRNQGVMYVHNPSCAASSVSTAPAEAGFLVINTRRRGRHAAGGDQRQRDGHRGAPHALVCKRRSAARRGGRDPAHRALAGGGECRDTPSGRPRVPGRRRRARRSAERRLRRQHRDPRRAQPGVEARGRDQGRGRPSAARQLRRRAATARPLDRRAGLHALRHTGRARTRYGRRRAIHRRPDDGARARRALRRDRRRRQPPRRRPAHPAVGGSRTARHTGAARHARLRIARPSTCSGAAFVALRPARRTSTSGRRRASKRTSSRRTGSPRPTACPGKARASFGRTASSGGVQAGRSNRPRSPAHWTRSGPERVRLRRRLRARRRSDLRG